MLRSGPKARHKPAQGKRGTSAVLGFICKMDKAVKGLHRLPRPFSALSIFPMDPSAASGWGVSEKILFAVSGGGIGVCRDERGSAQHDEVLKRGGNAAGDGGGEPRGGARRAVRGRLEDAPPHRVSQRAKDEVRVRAGGIR